MPKRVIDGEALWRSDKLNLVEPLSYRAEYANLIPLALANGSFEADSHRIYANVYAFNRPDITPEKVEAILAEFEHRKMLFLWRDPSTGKQWGYWVGIGKPGRLPPASRRGEHEVLGAEPPEAQLCAFLRGETNGQPLASQSVANGCLGLGSGSGTGKGSGGSSDSLVEVEHESGREPDFNSTEAAQYVCHQLELAGNELHWLVRDVIDGELKKSAGSTTAIAEAMVAAWQKYSTLRKGMKYTKGVKAFFGEAGFWKDESRWTDAGSAKLPNAVSSQLLTGPDSLLNRCKAVRGEL